MYICPKAGGSPANSKQSMHIIHQYLMASKMAQKMSHFVAGQISLNCPHRLLRVGRRPTGFQADLLSHVRKWATLSSGPLHNFLLNEGTHIQDTMFQVCLYGRGISAEELDQRHVISISKNVPNHQIDLKMAVSLFSLLCTF